MRCAGGRVGHLQPLDAGASGIVAPRGIGSLLPESMLAKDEQVHVQLPGSPAGALLPAERTLQRLEREEQRQGTPFRIAIHQDIERHDGVVELGLVGDPDRARGVEPRDTHEPAAGHLAQGADRPSERGRRRHQGSRPVPGTSAPAASVVLLSVVGRWRPCPDRSSSSSTSRRAMVSRRSPVCWRRPADSLVERHHTRLFRRAGAGRGGRRPRTRGCRHADARRLRPAARPSRGRASDPGDGIIVLGSGAVPLLRRTRRRTPRRRRERGRSTRA